MRKISYALLTIPVIGAALTVSAAAQSDYKGTTLKLIVSSAAGTSYDSYARAAARFLPKNIPGAPNVIVQNMPGAGGVVAANHLYTVAEKDGTTIALLNRNSLIQPVVGNKRARYRSERFYWLGTAASYRDEPYLFVVSSRVPYKSAAEMIKAEKPVQVGNSGSVMIEIIKETMGLNIKVVGGYDKNVLDLAFRRGEVDGIGVSYSNLLARFPDMMKEGTVRPIIQYGDEKRSKALPDVPTGRELAVSPEARALLAFVEAPLSMAYPYTLPPDVPAERATMMRSAFDKLWASAEYREEVLKQKLAHAPKTGAEVQQEVEELARAPQSVINRYVALAGAGAN